MKSTILDAKLGVGGKLFSSFSYIQDLYSGLFRGFDSCDIALIYVHVSYYGKRTTKGSYRSK